MTKRKAKVDKSLLKALRSIAALPPAKKTDYDSLALATQLFDRLDTAHGGNVLRCHADTRCPHYALLQELRRFITAIS